MSKTGSRKLIVVLAAGALSVFGAGGALAAGGPQAAPAELSSHGGEHGPGADEGNPLCAPPLAGLPICRADQEPDPPSEGPGAGEPADPGGEDSAPPA